MKHAGTMTRSSTGSRGRSDKDNETIVTTNNGTDAGSDIQKARDEYALNPVGSGSSKGSRTGKGGHLRLASNSTDGDDEDEMDSATRLAEEDGEGVRADSIEAGDRAAVVYKVYKRRWFGLAQITLLNIIASWDVSF